MSCRSHHDDHHDKHYHSNCVCEVLRAIKDLQDATTDDCFECKDCLTEPLGDLAGTRRRNADTRVFTLSTKDGKPYFAFFGPIEGTNSKYCEDVCVSIFFRVEEVYDNCCARLRVLVPLDENDNPVNITDDCCIDLGKVCRVRNFGRTHSCITVDLNCFCAVQCIKDVDLDICD
ncbi:spore coat protein Z [Bacillus ectoiniformans]|uniref:CotY/CotZ family spore coat protein n=1 Tax=Bacillus ectoiniformans TaxID=1494429 RepID=UPI00195828E1|nr:CotY/CotZ family spore coat protein [Bacillus ectoiniformans]MBM7647523.1 spore coat protein Z [Bacillus ectoiniformans]